MLIKRLRLKNFRSYKDEEIEFPKGIVLFEGDIGSGKSSLLYAIEFALFGLGEMRGESLMRVGENNCSVELEFEANKKNYIVFRSLSRKGESISQDEGYIIIDGRKIRLTSSEQRAKILEILNFKENIRARSSSFIYRYAIFTPQEEMKEILKMKIEDRLQTLRKVFGIEDYKIAKDNAKLVYDEIRNIVSFIEGEIKNLDYLIEEKCEKEKIIKEISKQIDSLKIERERLEEELKEATDKLESYEKLVIEINKLSIELPLLEKSIRENRKIVNDLIEDNKCIEAENNRLKKEKEKIIFEKIDADEKDLIEKIRATITTREKKIAEESEIKLHIRNFENIIEKGICPTCSRPITFGEFDKKLNEMKNKLEELRKDIEKSRIEENELNEILDKVRKFKENIRRLEDIEKKLEENYKRIEINKEKIEKIEMEINNIEEEIKEKRKKYEENRHISEEFEKIKERKRELENYVARVNYRISSLEGELKTLLEVKEKIEKEIEEKMKKKMLKENLEEKMLFIRDYFIPSLDDIEIIVMKEIKKEFNDTFRKYFYMLVEDDLVAKIDENFSPIVEQDGYEIDIDSLSGGEKTSVALAYRVALNLMVKKVSTSMKENLLILDEPTDGFSKEQIFKLRDVFNELKCDQIIIVSHEKELESFVDTIFYVEKSAGVSKIIKK